MWFTRHLEEHRKDLMFVIPTCGQHPTEAETLKRDQFPEVAKVQEIIN